MLLNSVIANLYPAHSNRSSPCSYNNYLDKLDVSMLNFPVKVDSSIDECEKLNSLTINIYTLENDIVVPVEISSNLDDEHTISILKCRSMTSLMNLKVERKL